MVELKKKRASHGSLPPGVKVQESIPLVQVTVKHLRHRDSIPSLLYIQTPSSPLFTSLLSYLSDHWLPLED